MQNQHTHLPLRDASFLATDTEIAFRFICLAKRLAVAAGVHQTVKLISESFRDSTHATAGTEGGS